MDSQNGVKIEDANEGSASFWGVPSLKRQLSKENSTKGRRIHFFSETRKMEGQTGGSKGNILEVLFDKGVRQRKLWNTLPGKTSAFLVTLKVRSSAQIKEGKWGEFNFLEWRRFGVSTVGILIED